MNDYNKKAKFEKYDEYKEEPKGFNIFPWVMSVLIIASIIIIIIEHV